MVTGATPDSEGNTIITNKSIKGGQASKAGFDYVISAREFDGAGEAETAMRDYLDNAFTKIQDNTSVDLNKIIPYAMDGLNITDGENPQQMMDRIVNAVQDSVKTGNPYGESKYITGHEQKNSIMDEYNQRDFDRDGGKPLTDDDIARNYSGNGYYNSPVYSDIPEFEGDANYQNQDLSVENTPDTDFQTDDATEGNTTEGGNMPDNSTIIPDNIPVELQPGMDQFVGNSNIITDKYNTRANSLWDDYLEFEKVYFDKFQDVQDTYQNNINSMPKMNMTMPDTMGGATIPLAPKVHSSMYGNQAGVMSDLIGNQGNTALAGMSSRNSINNNMFNANQTGLQNAFMPTQTGLDLYKMERASQLNLDAIHEGKPDDLSAWSAWSPVVGALLSSSPSRQTNMESAYDWITHLGD